MTVQQLNDAIFEAYSIIHRRTVGILTLSAKYRVQICVERQGKFIGDMIGECCRRAKVELDCENDIQLLSVSVFPNDEDGTQTEQDDSIPTGHQTTRDARTTSLPSFRSDNSPLCVTQSIH